MWQSLASLPFPLLFKGHGAQHTMPCQWLAAWLLLCSFGEARVDPPAPAKTRLGFLIAPAPALLPRAISYLAPAHAPLAGLLAGFTDQKSPSTSEAALPVAISPTIMTYNVTNGTCYGSGLFECAHDPALCLDSSACRECALTAVCYCRGTGLLTDFSGEGLFVILAGTWKGSGSLNATTKGTFSGAIHS